MKRSIEKMLKVFFLIVIGASFALAQETLEELNRRIEKLNQDIAQLSAAIEKNPVRSENYLRRGELYIELSNATDAVDYLPLARGVADFSKYLRLKPRDVDAYHFRADARFDLFIGYNPFSIRDLEKSVRLVPGDLETKDTLRNARAEYRKLLASAECRGNSNNAADRRAYPTNELVKILERLKNSAEKSNSGTKRALQLIACGANVNYVNPKSGAAVFSDSAQLPTPLVVALLEAGANPNQTDKIGNTPLLKTLDSTLKSGGEIDAMMLERIKIILDYGANPNHRNRTGQSVLSLARKTKNAALINLLIKRGAK